MDRLDLLLLRGALFAVEFDAFSELDHVEAPTVRAASLPAR